MYDKVTGIYYNPKTYQLLTDPIQATGGVVYLNAQDIVSTGNGKIIAAGGAADIDINGGLYKLVVKNIDTSSRPDPLVMINGVACDPPKEGDNLQNGVFTDYSGDGSLFAISSARNTGKKVYGETSVTKNEKNILETIASWFLPVSELVTKFALQVWKIFSRVGR